MKNVICDYCTAKCGCRLLWCCMWIRQCPSQLFSAYLLYFIKEERLCLTLQEMEDLCKLHCLSVVFLLHLPLSQRACTRFIVSHWIEDIQTFLKMVNMFFIRLWIYFFVSTVWYIKTRVTFKIRFIWEQCHPFGGL